jgi:transcriptional regulator with XRE-family HTH domain
MARNNLKSTLEKEGIRQSELARKSGVGSGTVNRACNQRRTPTATIRNKLVKSLNELAGKEYGHDDIFPSRA